ncbi:MAG TPA: hypothetical protein VJC18_11135, partial [bacterium]|nr:hypothetical protein [bacterium]
QGRQDCLDTVCREAVAVFNHNIETVARLTPLVRSVARYQRSLEVISYVHKTYPHIRTKSGLMLGLGETRDEVLQSMRDLRAHGCQLLTLGQYLQPTRKHYPVMAHISQEQFTEYENLGREMGFETVFAGTFVRSSYRAGGYTKDEGRKHEGRGTRDEGTRDENTRDEGQAEWTLRQAQGRLKGREKTKIKNEKCKMQNAKCKMQNAKCQPHD